MSHQRLAFKDIFMHTHTDTEKEKHVRIKTSYFFNFTKQTNKQKKPLSIVLANLILPWMVTTCHRPALAPGLVIGNPGQGTNGKATFQELIA
jgi:hypothetical protein